MMNQSAEKLADYLLTVLSLASGYVDISVPALGGSPSKRRVNHVVSLEASKCRPREGSLVIFWCIQKHVNFEQNY